MGRAPFEYRAPRTPAPLRMPSSPAPPSPAPPSSPSPRPMSRPAPYIRRTFTPARPAPPPPPPPPSAIAYRGAPAPNATLVTRSRFPTSVYSSEAFGPPPPYSVRQTPTRMPHRATGPPAPPSLPPPPPPPSPSSSRVTPEDLQALLPPPTTSMDQKTQSSFQVCFQVNSKTICII